jgi:hypothetical protein
MDYEKDRMAKRRSHE